MPTLNFKYFLIESHKKFMKDVEQTIGGLPKKHRELVKDYSFERENGNTLHGDDGHVGVIDEKKKKIKVASPWNYGREFTILHEVAHAVWKYLVDKKQRNDWKNLLEKARKKHSDNKELEQAAEEVFCMIYAQHYCKNKVLRYNIPELIIFIKNLPS